MNKHVTLDFLLAKVCVTTSASFLNTENKQLNLPLRGSSSLQLISMVSATYLPGLDLDGEHG